MSFTHCKDGVVNVMSFTHCEEGVLDGEAEYCPGEMRGERDPNRDDIVRVIASGDGRHLASRTPDATWRHTE